MSKIYKCDKCQKEIPYTHSPTGNQWLYEITISPMQCPCNRPSYEICEECRKKLQDFLGSNS